MERRRIAVLAACLLASGATGVCYSYSVFSGGLKKRFGWDQDTVDSVGEFTFMAGFWSFATGALADRLGPRRACAIGGTAVAGLQLLYWGVGSARVRTAHPDLVLMVLGPALDTANHFLVVGIFTTLVRNFPRQSGAVVGAAKGWVGLFSGATTQMFAGLFFVPDQHDPASIDYLPFVAAVVLLSVVVPSPLIAVLPRQTRLEEEREAPLLRRRLRVAYALVAAVAALVTAAAVLKHDLRRRGHVALAVAIVALWVALPASVSLPDSVLGGPAEYARAPESEDEEDIIPPVPDKHSLVAPHSDGDDQSRSASPSADPACEDEDKSPSMSLWEMVQTLECWILCFSVFAVQGGGIMLTTNLSQICDSTGLGASAAAVSLFSVGQALSRMGGGVVSDMLMLRGVRRTLFFATVPLPMCLGYGILLCARSEAALYTGVVLCAASFGAIHPLTIVCNSELFGNRNLGSNYMLCSGWGNAAGSFVLAKLVAEAIYDLGADSSADGAPSMASDSSDGGNNCYGHACFGWSFAIAGALSAAASAAVAVVDCRNRHLYARIIARMRATDA